MVHVTLEDSLFLKSVYTSSIRLKKNARDANDVLAHKKYLSAKIIDIDYKGLVYIEFSK
jgi:hypothetical protein